MSLFRWDESYSVGYLAIDAQHKRWFQLAQDLHSSVVTGKSKATLGKALSSFIAYTGAHFAAEERLMLTHAYPDYAQHKLEHEELTDKLVQFQQEFQAGRTTVTLELLRFLRVWLGEHISVVDSTVGDYLNQRK